MYSGEVGHLSQPELSQLLGLGRQLQVAGILSCDRLPQNKTEEEEEVEDDDVFESEIAVDLSPGSRYGCLKNRTQYATNAISDKHRKRHCRL